MGPNQREIKRRLRGLELRCKGNIVDSYCRFCLETGIVFLRNSFHKIESNRQSEFVSYV